MSHENPILAFARDFSGNDAVIIKQAQDLIAHPPQTEKSIGFYGSEEYNPNARSFLATVSLLEDKGKIDSVEDKYTPDILIRWRDEKVIDPETLAPAAKAVFGPLATREVDNWIRVGNADALPAYRKTLWPSYAKATQELEQHIASRGRVLLSIDATDGDTMFFALVSPEIAQRWRDKALCEQDGYRSGVRSPMWDRFWDHLVYSLQAEEYYPGSYPYRVDYPPGTRRRSDAIPFAD